MSQQILLTMPAGSPRQDLASYRAEGGYVALERTVSGSTPQAALAEVETSKLRGRGGASFPCARKWSLAAAQNSDIKYVLANGGEHEPGTAKDKHLVEFYPHKVIEGMMLCGFATGATRGYIYLMEDMAAQIASVEAALTELCKAGLLGEPLFGSDFCFDIEVHCAPVSYVAGEETAAIDSINGGPGKPLPKPPYPGEQGVDGKPTTVNNVETMAHLPFLFREGGAKYASIGTAESTGTMLFTLGAEVNNPGVYELPFGSTYRELIEGNGGGLKSGKAIRAILPALSSAFLDASHLDTPIAYETLKEHNTSPGSGGVRVIEDGEDIVARVAEIAQFFMEGHCGQCPPCGMSTSQMVHILNAVQAQKGQSFKAHVDELVAFVRGRCSLPLMATAAVQSAFVIFADEFNTVEGS